MKSRPIRHALIAGACLLMGDAAIAGGITADVGLTPPKDRWIFRSQLRYQERGDDPTAMDREVRTLIAPAVLAYGLRSDVTVIARQMFFHREMKSIAGTDEKSGYGDLALISKWRALRINRPDYIIGIAPTFGIELPTGDDDFGSETWDAQTGLYFTARRGEAGADLNLQYVFNGVEDRSAADGRPGDVFNANLALSYQFTLDEQATMSLWPVLELTYTDIQRAQLGGSNMPNTGGDVFTVAPGIKFARQSFMLEALIQIPVRDHYHGDQLERGVACWPGCATYSKLHVARLIDGH